MTAPISEWPVSYDKVVNDLGHVADHNAIVLELQSLQAQVNAIQSGSSTGLPGTILVDAQPGTDDSAKLQSAIDLASSTTYSGGRPTILFGPRVYSMSRPFVPFRGMKLSGPTWSPQEEALNGGYDQCRITMNSTLGTTPWINWTNGERSVIISNLTFYGNGQSQFITTGSATSLKWSVFDNCTWSGFRGVLGSSTDKCYLTGLHMTGRMAINGGTNCAINIGGADNVLFPQGCFVDSSAMQTPSGRYHFILDALGKTFMGPIYMTCQALGGILVRNNNEGQTVIAGARIEGKNATEHCLGALVRVEGGGLTLRDCWLGYAMAQPASGSNSSDAGVIHQTGGRLLLGGCCYGRGYTGPFGSNTGTVTAPVVYSSGGYCRVSDLITISGTSNLRHAGTSDWHCDDSIVPIT